MALLEESLSQPIEDTGMQSVLRTLLKKNQEHKNKNTHTHFKFLQEHRNVLNTISQETALFLKNHVFEMNLQHFKF